MSVTITLEDDLDISRGDISGRQQSASGWPQDVELMIVGWEKSRFRKREIHH